VLQPKTRIGSPYVIAGLESALENGGTAVCGWEANGGFLTGSPIERLGRTLAPLATRDAVLPILCVLLAAQEQSLSLFQLFSQLPTRYSRAALLKRFPRSVSRQLIDAYSPAAAGALHFSFGPPPSTRAGDAQSAPAPALQAQMERIRAELQNFFPASMGFTEIAELNYIDGVRVIFSNGEVAHVRPSGNADELRIYAVADSQERADAICQMGVAEPGGILRAMEKARSASSPHN
jgi:phosphomannomutase